MSEGGKPTVSESALTSRQAKVGPPKLARVPGERRWIRQLRLSFLRGFPERRCISRPFSRGRRLATAAAMSKHFVYILKNAEIPPRYYTGLTGDPARRLAEHNAGCGNYSSRYGPWSLDVLIEFADERRAVAFEQYLKTGSGVAFAMRHLRYACAMADELRAHFIASLLESVVNGSMTSDAALRAWPDVDSETNKTILLGWIHLSHYDNEVLHVAHVLAATALG